MQSSFRFCEMSLPFGSDRKGNSIIRAKFKRCGRKFFKTNCSFDFSTINCDLSQNS